MAKKCDCGHFIYYCPDCKKTYCPTCDGQGSGGWNSCPHCGSSGRVASDGDINHGHY